MSDRRTKAESGEGTDEQSSQGTRRPSDPLHPSPPYQSYYSHPSSNPQYPQGSMREGISAYASYRGRSGAPLPPHPRAPPHYQLHGHGPPPINPRSSAQQVTPDSRQPPFPMEFMSPQSAVRRRYEPSPAHSSQPSAKRPRRSGTFLEPQRVQVSLKNSVLSSVYNTWQTFSFCVSED